MRNLRCVARSDFIEVKINGTVLRSRLIKWIQKKAPNLLWEDGILLRFSRIVAHLDFLIDQLSRSRIASRKRAGDSQYSRIVLVIDFVREIADRDHPVGDYGTPGVGDSHSANDLNDRFGRRPVRGFRCAHPLLNIRNYGGSKTKSNQENQVVVNKELHCRRHEQDDNPLRRRPCLRLWASPAARQRAMRGATCMAVSGLVDIEINGIDIVREWALTI
jgi:hypothetical protein